MKTRNFTKPILIFLLGAIVPIQFALHEESYAQINPTLDSALQRTLDSMREVQSSPGISAAVTIPNHGTWLGVSGISHVNVNITPGMKFGIGSETKTFIAVLMLKLAEMNVLSIDDSLDRWLPGFQYVDSTITIRQILNHTSGVYNFTEHSSYNISMNSDTGRRWTPEEVLSTFMNPPYFPPGQGWHYSNTNYLLAGMVIKAATDTVVSFKLKQLILNPLNLTSTFYAVEETIPDTIAHGWINGNDRGNYPRTSWYSSIWAAGSMYSIPENMARFYQLLFDSVIINQSYLSQMLTFIPVQGGPFDSYGLGISRAVINGRAVFGHGGDWWGYRSVTGLDSAEHFIISAEVNERPTSDPLAVFAALHLTVINNPIGIVKNNEIIPQAFHLYQNYPNPFNPVTHLGFEISDLRFVKLNIYDILGREAVTLVNEELKPGGYEVEWDATNFPSGVYFYKLTAGDYAETKKMVLLK